MAAERLPLRHGDLEPSLGRKKRKQVQFNVTLYTVIQPVQEYSSLCLKQCVLDATTRLFFKIEAQQPEEDCCVLARARSYTVGVCFCCTRPSRKTCWLPAAAGVRVPPHTRQVPNRA